MEWISVSDRLPDDENDYLVTDGDACMVSTFRMESQSWDLHGLWWWSSSEVTHWQPLPPPPLT